MKSDFLPQKGAREKQSLKLSEREGDNEEQSRNTKNRNEKNNMIEKLNKTRSW